MNTNTKIIKRFSLPLIHIYGDNACFTRPELKIERVSYDVPTPSALEGLLKAIYWHPGVNYMINKIYVQNEIEFESRVCNEIKTTLRTDQFVDTLLNQKPLPHANNSVHDIRNTTHLINVDYIIEATMAIDDSIENPNDLIKYLIMFKRRLSKGQNFYEPYFGLREFRASVEVANKEDIKQGYYYNRPNYVKDLGTMLYGLDFLGNTDTVETVKYFHPFLKNGCVNVDDYEVFYYDYPRSH